MNSLFKLLLIFIFSIFYKSVCAQFTVDFNSSTVTGCAGVPINFTDLSISSSGIVSWVWDFGDGNSSTLQNPSHVYTTAGTYTVILTANNGSISVDKVKANYILIYPLPQPSFTLSNPSCVLPVSLTVSNVLPSTSVSYSWNFGNGQTSTSQNPTGISYTAEGVYSVQLTTINSATGCANSTEQSLNIYNYNTDFTPSALTVCIGSPVTFSDNSSPGTNQYSWDFGNGQNSTSSNPSTTYGSAGTYTVTLNSQNTVNGCSDVVTKTITVITAQIPTISPSMTIGCNPSIVTFTNTSGFSGTFTWDFGNNNTFVGTNPPPQVYSMNPYNLYPYSVKDSFSVLITSIDQNGCYAGKLYTDLINIYNIVPTFSGDFRLGCEDLHTTFTDNSYSPIPGFPINSWSWNFGNGQTYSGQNPPIQTYSEGLYNVSLTVSTAMGCTTTVDSSRFVQVGIPQNALFTVLPDTLCARNLTTFTNLTTLNAPATWDEVNTLWFIGSQISTQFEPNNVPIITVGPVDVTLIVTFRGCADTVKLEDAFYVHPPLVRFNNPNVLCNPQLPAEVLFNDNSILGDSTDSVAISWDFGDGTIVNYDNDEAWLNNNQLLGHTYTNYGHYVIQQKIWNFDTGCVDSLYSEIQVNYFALDLNFVNDSICLGDTSEFLWTHESIVDAAILNYYYVADSDSILGYSWDFPQTITNPDSCYFSTSGNHQITIHATNIFGCPASITETVYVAPLPQAGIGPIQLAGCLPNDALYQDSSTSVSGIPIIDYYWTFNGTAPTSGNHQPTITTFIPDTNSYTTMLQVTDELGCKNSITLQTDFLEPVANFDAPPIICNNSMFLASNLSTNYISSSWYLNGLLVSTDNDGNFLISHLELPNTFSYVDSITLVATDAFGCSHSITSAVVTSCPNANFSFNLTGSNLDEFGNFSCPSVFSAFTDDSESYGDILGWQWDFGDGKFSDLQNPNNTYVFAGTYTSSLTITDEFGCKDSIVFPDFLTISGPSGTFDVGPAGTLCDPNYLFLPLSLDNVSTVEWFPGNGTSFSSFIGGEYIYPTAGTYFPYVTIKDANNCSITYYLDTLTVYYGNLNAAFIGTPTVLNWGQPLVINNESTGGIGGIINNNWQIGTDNFNDQSSEFNYQFTEAGELQVLLTIIDSLGCIDTALITVYVTDNLELPNVFSPNGDGVNDDLRIRDNAYAEYEVIILNRWGNVMSRSQVVNDDYLWNGITQNGSLAVDGVYYYFVNGVLRDGQPKKDHGFFHLVR